MGRRSTRRSSDEGPSHDPKRRRRHRYPTRYSSRVRRDKLLGGDQAGRKNIISDEDFRDKNEVLKEEIKGSPLLVKELDTQDKENKVKHFTDEFEQDELIVRRGWEFSIKLTFNREVKKDSDVIVLQFSYGPRPQESKGTLIRLPIDLENSASDEDGWTASATKVEGDEVTISVMTEPDSNIGKYTMFVETKVKGSEEDFSRAEQDENVFLLFNPWCEDDLVYMPNEDERYEYVLNEHGYIWVGSYWNNRGRAWDFGQFESPVLEVALELLDKGELGDSARNSPVSIIRCLSALINSNDEFGLLEGKWDRPYPSGTTKPWEWNGSVAICEEYHKTKKPVLYGQCWVFSGVATTLLRCLGIPTRSVTNFRSAHDCDCSMTIDHHFDMEGDPLDHMDDSVWNFHVWNESYLKRIDLPVGYDGWQAHDATPQEESGGVSRCGPAPLKAVKEGQVYLNFDTNFIFAEVNGDEVTWKQCPDGSFEVTEIDKGSVGKYISTKAVGSAERHDLTLDYKYPEGSEEERRIVKDVNKFSSRHRKKKFRNIYEINLKKEVGLEVIVPTDKEVGDDIEVGVKVTNLGSEKRTLRVKMTLASTFYTGVVGKAIQGERFEKSFDANESDQFVMPVSSKTYEEGMNSAAEFKVTVSCRVLETDRLYAKTETFDLLTQFLSFKIPEIMPSYTDLTIPVTFTNKTNMKLHNAVIRAGGSYFVKDKHKAHRAGKTLYPGDEFTAEIPIFSRRNRKLMLIASFSSDELDNIVDEAGCNFISKSDYKE